MVFAEPVGLTRDVMGGIEQGLEKLIARMALKEVGIRILRVTVTQVDHSRKTIEIGVSRPTRSIPALRSLLTAPVDRLDAGFGIERLEILASQTDRLGNDQSHLGIENTGTHDNQTIALIDTLSNRFGFDRVLRFAPADSHLPERSHTVISAAFSELDASWQPPAALRPVRLLQMPEILPYDQATHHGYHAATHGEFHPPDPPREIFWRGLQRHITPFAGPERIEPEWWHDDPQWRTGARDYWWVHDETGLALWLFSTRGSRQWFVHGYGA